MKIVTFWLTHLNRKLSPAHYAHLTLNNFPDLHRQCIFCPVAHCTFLAHYFSSLFNFFLLTKNPNFINKTENITCPHYLHFISNFYTSTISNFLLP